jgi:DNA-binding NtrC family response regulator
MPSIPKKILVVARDPALMLTRAAILKHHGYDVVAVESAAEALARIEAEWFDLVLLGRKSTGAANGVDVQVRKRYPTLPILKIALGSDPDTERDATRQVDANPVNVIHAVRELLGE